MHKKWDRKGNIWKESNLDPFVLKSDHSRRNCDTAMSRSRCSAQAKNTVAFRRNNKEERRATPENKVSYIALAPSWCDCLQSAGFKQKCFLGVENKLSAREKKMAADGTFLVFCDPVRSSCVVYSGPLLCLQYSDQLLSLTIESGVCLSDWWPAFFSTSISLVPLSGVMHHCGVLAGTLYSWAQMFHSTLDVDHFLIWERPKRNLRARRTRKKESRQGKRLGRLGGDELMSFHVHSLSFWCTHQNNLRPTAASPGG